MGERVAADEGLGESEARSPSICIGSGDVTDGERQARLLADSGLCTEPCDGFDDEVSLFSLRRVTNERGDVRTGEPYEPELLGRD